MHGHSNWTVVDLSLSEGGQGPLSMMLLVQEERGNEMLRLSKRQVVPAHLRPPTLLPSYSFEMESGREGAEN